MKILRKINIKYLLVFVAIFMLLFSMQIYQTAEAKSPEQNAPFYVVLGNEEKTKYEFSWPQQTTFELININTSDFISRTQLMDLEITFYKEVEQSYVQVSDFSIGNFKAVVSPKDNSFYVENPEFYFKVDYTYLNLVWGTNTFNYTGEIISPEYSLTGNTYGNKVSPKFTDDSDRMAKEVGDYSIEVTGLDNEYFKISNTSATTFNWSIVATELTIVWGNNNFTYGDECVPTACAVLGDISIPLNVSVFNNEEIEDVKVYDITASLPSEYASCYTLAGQTVSRAVVSPAVVEVEFGPQSEFFYNGEYVTITCEVVSDIGEDVEVYLKNNHFKDAGKYVAEIVGLSSENYDVIDKTFEWEIKPKEIRLTWNGVEFPYTGHLIKPMPLPIDTGIEGETITPIVHTNINIDVNVGTSNPYIATASLPTDVKNYKLLNTTHTYYIVKARPYVRVDEETFSVYNGQKQLPEYYFFGEEESLRIFINGIEVSDGVKDPGEYVVRFESKESKNFLASNGGFLTKFTIRPRKLEKQLDKLELVFENPNMGFENGKITVSEIDFDGQLLLKNPEYNECKAFEVLIDGKNDGIEAKISIKRTPVENIKVFRLLGGEFIEINCTADKDVLKFGVEEGKYFVLTKKVPFLSSPLGIILLIVVSVLVMIGIICFALLSKGKKGDRSLNKLIEEKLAEKIQAGEEINADTVSKIREDLLKEKNDKKETLSVEEDKSDKQ